MAPEPCVCLGRHCLGVCRLPHFTGFWPSRSTSSITPVLDSTLNFWPDPYLQTDDPMALMLLTCFDHCHQLRSWLLFYGFFFSSESVSRLNCYQNLCRLLPPAVVSAVFIALRHQTVLLITVNPFSLWLAQVVL